MTELRILLVDDEPPALARIARLIAEIEGAQLVGCEDRASAVVARCRALTPDLVLLDVEMPEISGVRLARRLGELPFPPAIIFVTAYEDYALDAFELAAVDYLVKPVRKERLVQALERVRVRRTTRQQTIVARLGERLMSIPVDRVRALLAEDKYTCIHHLDGTALIEDSLIALERRFGERFVRVHRNALVSRDHIRALVRDSEGVERVELEDVGVRPEVSRRNLAAVRRLIRGEA